MMSSGQSYNLTPTEQEIMDVIWNAENGLNFQQILDIMNNKYDKQWRPQTLRTFLTGLQKAELIEARGSRKSQLYYPLRTRDEYLHRCTRRLVERSYGNSLRSFLSAFAGGQPLDEEDIQSLRDLIEQSGSDRKKNK